MTAYEAGLSNLDPVSEARGMDALARARAMRARVESTLHDSPVRHPSKSPGGADGSPLFDDMPSQREPSAAGGDMGLEPAVTAARGRIATRGAQSSPDEVSSAKALLASHSELGGASHSIAAEESQIRRSMAAAQDETATPPWWFTPVQYTHLWTSADGETHLEECRVSDMEVKGYSGTPQAVRDGLPAPTSVVFTELPSDFDNPWHLCPAPQWVITLRGGWFVKASDGTTKEFGPGDVLFQDNTSNSPAASSPRHYSGTVGRGPCQQMIVQVAWAPQVDHPAPF